jgi:peptide-methionine (S)-S-oxide reductase
MTRTVLAALALTLFTAAPTHAETAIFAGGCFWCVEKDMDHITGVTKTTSGYAGGTLENPTYENHEGHVEAVKVEFDPKVVPYDQLLARFLRTIDVTDAEGQFCDRGFAYTTAVFTTTPDQAKTAAEVFQAAAAQLGQPIVTPVKPATTFTDAEDYHQDYYLGENRVLTRFGFVKQSDAYAGYRKGCGRDARVKQVWGASAYTTGNGS